MFREKLSSYRFAALGRLEADTKPAEARAVWRARSFLSACSLLWIIIPAGTEVHGLAQKELIRQFKFNPEVDTRLEAFMKAEPGLVKFVKELPREQLERKFLLRKMRDRDKRQRYTAKVKTWLEKPEQAELVRSIQATISDKMKPEQQALALVN
jgi:hypothetical protein